MQGLALPFYLTGGTALSRHYFAHRYSDDLDYADLWVIAGHRSFSWKNVVEEARTKEAGLDSVVLYDLLRSFPREMLPTTRWAVEVDPNAFLKDLHRLAEDLFFMRDNSHV